MWNINHILFSMWGSGGHLIVGLFVLLEPTEILEAQVKRIKLELLLLLLKKSGWRLLTSIWRQVALLRTYFGHLDIVLAVVWMFGSLQHSYVEILITNTIVLRGGAFGSWSGHEGKPSSVGLVHFFIKESHSYL